VSIPWYSAPAVNRYFADDSLACRQAAALRAFARRDPRWLAGLGVAVAVLGLAVLGVFLNWPRPVVAGPGDHAAAVAVTAFAAASVAVYAGWEWLVAARARRIVSHTGRKGTLLTSSFGPRGLRLTTPDISYEIPYASITHIARFDDVLVVKPRSSRVLALPMELVPPAELELFRSRVAAGAEREASLTRP
jgi:hypothetical protein